jgi:hypothetical protein
VVVKPLQYDDFDVVIEGSGDAFRAKVVNSPGGETHTLPFVLPVSEEKLELLVLRLRTAHGVRVIEADTAPDTKQFGGELFDALFHDDLLDSLRRSLIRTDAQGRGLRIRLRFSDAHELWNIPWELLYDNESHRFLCQFDTTPVVRYVDMAQPVKPLIVHGPIRMLVMISSPDDYPPLDVEKEWQQLSGALKPLEATGSLTVERLPAASLEELRHTMMFGDFHVFHYIGHGGLDKQTGDGLLVLTGSDGRSQLATGPELFVMLANSPIRLAVLNSCQGARISTIDPYAGTAASLVHQGIPAVVAMQFEISDHAAIAFSRTLYEAIAYGWPVDMAVGEARRAILATSKSEWATPVLYLRAPDGILVEVTKPARAPAPAQPTGLDGSVADGVVALQWAAVPAGLTPVSRWEVRRDGTRVGDAAEPRASDDPPGPGSYQYTVVAVGEDGQRSVESAVWSALVSVVSPPPSRRQAPAAPTGLNGTSSAGRVDLHWDPAAPGSVGVTRWEIFRDGAPVAEATSPRASDLPPRMGSYRYTVLAVGEDGQPSAHSVSWTAEVSTGRPRWLVPVLAILGTVFATVGLFLWAPWQPDDTDGATAVATPDSTTPDPTTANPAPPPPLVWTPVPDGFQENFSAAGVVEHNDELWVVGGVDGNGKRDDVRIFDPQLGEWRDGPKLPEGVSHAPLASTGETLYLLGGLTTDDVPLATVYRLDSPNGTWVADVPLPAPRLAGAAAWDGRRLVFAGGAEQMSPRLASAYIWALQSGKWEPIGMLQEAREHLAAVTNDEGTIWFVGGVDVGRALVVVDNVDLLNDNTVSDGSAFTPIQDAATIWTDETGICVFGGSTTLPNALPREPVKRVECQGGAEPAPTWPDLPDDRASAGAAVIDDTVYVVGGYSAKGVELEAADMVLALQIG